MVAGYHLIWTAYGWWLPNDPRGSTSHEIRMVHIEPLGELHRGRKIIQPSSREIREFYERARRMLRHELLTFTPNDFELIAQAFAGVVAEKKYTCYACAIMPDHVHMLIRKHRYKAEQMIEDMQIASRQALIRARRRPPLHPVWGGPGWNVFLETRKDFERTVGYIERNPPKAGLPAQMWAFVKPYDGWMPYVPYWLKDQRATP
jgi:REP element-mobilizing transposase RayT